MHQPAVVVCKPGHEFCAADEPRTVGPEGPLIGVDKGIVPTRFAEGRVERPLPMGVVDGVVLERPSVELNAVFVPRPDRQDLRVGRAVVEDDEPGRSCNREMMTDPPVEAIGLVSGLEDELHVGLRAGDPRADCIGIGWPCEHRFVRNPVSAGTPDQMGRVD